MASRPKLRLPAAAFAILAALSTSVNASAALTPTITEFSAGLNPGSNLSYGVAPGPDGNVWFTDSGGTAAIGRITPAGAITEFSQGLAPKSAPSSIASGPDGNLWFTDPGAAAIGRITPSGEITEFTEGLSPASGPTWITGGPDGNLWFTDSSATVRAIGRITPAGAITEFSNGLNANAILNSITVGGDGNLWFADGAASPAIGRITPGGAITEFGLGLQPGDNPYGIAAGADGNVWFSDSSSPGAEIGRVDPSGTITKFSSGLPSESAPYFIGSGPDGAAWFTDEVSPENAIGRITPAGEISEYSAGLRPAATVYGIGPGPDGNVWFTDNTEPSAVGRITTPPAVVTGAPRVLGAGAATVRGTVNGHSQQTVARFEYVSDAAASAASAPIDTGSGSVEIPVSARLSDLRPGTAYRYRLAATNPTGPSTGAEGAFTTLALPVVSGLRVKPRVWRRGRRPAKASLRDRRVPVGTRIIFRLNRAAPVRLSFFAKHRRRGKVRLRTAGSISLRAHRGRNTVRFQGRISKKKRLRPGRYRLEVTARDPTVPKRTSRQAAGFRVVGRR